VTCICVVKNAKVNEMRTSCVQSKNNNSSDSQHIGIPMFSAIHAVLNQITELTICRDEDLCGLGALILHMNQMSQSKWHKILHQ